MAIYGWRRMFERHLRLGELTSGMRTAVLRLGQTGYLAKGSLGAQLPDLVARCASGEAILAVPGSAEALRGLIGSALDSRAT
jgi:hypothetical protein